MNTNRFNRRRLSLEALEDRYLPSASPLHALASHAVLESGMPAHHQQMLAPTVGGHGHTLTHAPATTQGMHTLSLVDTFAAFTVHNDTSYTQTFWIRFNNTSWTEYSLRPGYEQTYYTSDDFGQTTEGYLYCNATGITYGFSVGYVSGNAPGLGAGAQYSFHTTANGPLLYYGS